MYLICVCMCADLLKITSLTRGPADTQQFTACDIGILNKHGDTCLYRRRIRCLSCVRHWEVSVTGFVEIMKRELQRCVQSVKSSSEGRAQKQSFKLVGPSKGQEGKILNENGETKEERVVSVVGL